MKIKLENANEEKDAVYPQEFITLVHEPICCFKFFCLSLLQKWLFCITGMGFIVSSWFLHPFQWILEALQYGKIMI